MEKILAIRELMVLFRHMDRFVVHVPLMQARLAHVQSHERQALVKLSATHAREYKQLGNYVEHDEVPDFGNYQDTLRQGGLCALDSEVGVDDLLAESGEQDRLQGGDRYYFAFDNNALRNRVLSTVFLPRADMLRNPSWSYVVSEYVRSELDDRGQKYAWDLRQLRTLNLGKWTVSVFRNQPRLAERLRAIGLTEYQKAQSLPRTEVAAETYPVEELRMNRQFGEMDRWIADSYAEFAKGPDRMVIYLSHDRSAIRSAMGLSNLRAVQLDYAPIQKTMGCRWETLCEWLYALALVYGRLELQTTRGKRLVWLDGVWAGKEASHWVDEQLRLTTCPDTTLSAGNRRKLSVSLQVLHRAGEDGIG